MEPKDQLQAEYDNFVGPGFIFSGVVELPGAL